MEPRLIHLIWFGEITQDVLDSVDYWKKEGGNREVVLHTDNSLLLPELKPIYDKHVASREMNRVRGILNSDLLRWSILSRIGGWYIDIDVRFHSSLDTIESKYQLNGNKCFISRLFKHGMFNGDILATAPNWCGNQIVTDALVRAGSKEEVKWLDFALPMLHRLMISNPDIFTIGDDNDFCLDSKESLVSRQGQWKMLPVTSSLSKCDICINQPVDCWKTKDYGCEQDRQKARVAYLTKCPYK